MIRPEVENIMLIKEGKVVHTRFVPKSVNFFPNCRLALVVKLAVIMGVIWTCEVTTAFFSDMRNYSNFTKKLEIFLDSVTCLQGKHQ